MKLQIPNKYIDLLCQELEHFGNCDNWQTCDRCNKLIQDLSNLKLRRLSV